MCTCTNGGEGGTLLVIGLLDQWCGTVINKRVEQREEVAWALERCFSFNSLSSTSVNDNMKSTLTVFSLS